MESNRNNLTKKQTSNSKKLKDVGSRNSSETFFPTPPEEKKLTSVDKKYLKAFEKKATKVSEQIVDDEQSEQPVNREQNDALTEEVIEEKDSENKVVSVIDATKAEEERLKNFNEFFKDVIARQEEEKRKQANFPEKLSKKIKEIVKSNKKILLGLTKKNTFSIEDVKQLNQIVVLQEKELSNYIKKNKLGQIDENQLREALIKEVKSSLSNEFTVVEFIIIGKLLDYNNPKILNADFQKLFQRSIPNTSEEFLKFISSVQIFKDHSVIILNILAGLYQRKEDLQNLSSGIEAAKIDEVLKKLILDAFPKQGKLQKKSSSFIKFLSSAQRSDSEENKEENTTSAQLRTSPSQTKK